MPTATEFAFAPIAYVQTPYAALGTELFAEVRGKRTPMTVSSTPFTPNGYFRG